MLLTKTIAVGLVCFVIGIKSHHLYFFVFGQPSPEVSHGNDEVTEECLDKSERRQDLLEGLDLAPPTKLPTETFGLYSDGLYSGQSSQVQMAFEKPEQDLTEDERFERILKAPFTEQTKKEMAYLAKVESTSLYHQALDSLQDKDATAKELAEMLIRQAIRAGNTSALESLLQTGYDLALDEEIDEQDKASIVNLISTTGRKAEDLDDNIVHQSIALLTLYGDSESVYIRNQAIAALVSLAPNADETQDRLYRGIDQAHTVEDKIALLDILKNTNNTNESIYDQITLLADSNAEPIAVRARAMALLARWQY